MVQRCGSSLPVEGGGGEREAVEIALGRRDSGGFAARGGGFHRESPGRPGLFPEAWGFAGQFRSGKEGNEPVFVKPGGVKKVFGGGKPGRGKRAPGTPGEFLPDSKGAGFLAPFCKGGGKAMSATPQRGGKEIRGEFPTAGNFRVEI